MTTRSLEELWLEIEASPKPRLTGWVRRVANPSAAVAVHAAVSCTSGARSLMIDVPTTALGRLQDLPATGGLAVTLAPPFEGAPLDQRSITVELEDPQFSDIFSIFCADLVEGVSRCTRVNDALALLLQRLGRWQRFLSNAVDGLSTNAVAGLFGELWILRTILVPRGGIGLVNSWTGAQRAPQDFVVPGLFALEVKTSTAKILSSVRVHGERQLDDSGLACLYLACLRLERDDATGISINDLVTQLRALASDGPEFRLTLDVLLAQAGWMERHAHRYEHLRYNVEERRFFQLGAAFPRVLSAELPIGVRDINYELELKACTAFECTEDAMSRAISDLPPLPSYQ